MNRRNKTMLLAVTAIVMIVPINARLLLPTYWKNKSWDLEDLSVALKLVTPLLRRSGVNILRLVSLGRIDSNELEAVAHILTLNANATLFIDGIETSVNFSSSIKPPDPLQNNVPIFPPPQVWLILVSSAQGPGEAAVILENALQTQPATWSACDSFLFLFLDKDSSDCKRWRTEEERALRLLWQKQKLLHVLLVPSCSPEEAQIDTVRTFTMVAIYDPFEPVQCQWNETVEEDPAPINNHKKKENESSEYDKNEKHNFQENKEIDDKERDNTCRGKVIRIPSQKALKTSRRRDLNLRKAILRICMFPRYPSAVPLPENATVQPEDWWEARLLPAKTLQRYAGEDARFVQELAAFLGAHPVPHAPPSGQEYGYWDVNTKRFTGALGQLADARADLVANTFFLKDYAAPHAEFFSPHGRDEVCVVVPCAHPEPKLRLLDLPLVAALAAAMLICSALWRLAEMVGAAASKRSNTRGLRTRSSHATSVNEGDYPENGGGKQGASFGSGPPELTLFRALVGGSAARTPSATVPRLLLVACLMLGLVVAAAAQGALLHLFSRAPRGLDINTLEDLEHSGLAIGTASPNLEDIFGVNSPLAARLRLVLPGGAATARAASQRDIAALVSFTHMGYWAPTHGDECKTTALVEITNDQGFYHLINIQSATRSLPVHCPHKRYIPFTQGNESPPCLSLVRLSDARWDARQRFGGRSQVGSRGQHAPLHVVSECPRAYLLALLAPRGHPLLPRFNHFSRTVSEAGLLKYWRQQEWVRLGLPGQGPEGAAGQAEEEESELRVFSLWDVQLAFRVLLVGLGVSIVAFAAEFVASRCTRRRRARVIYLPRSDGSCHENQWHCNQTLCPLTS